MPHRESVRFPGSGHIWVPRSGRRAAAAGLSLYSPCLPVAVFAQRLLYLGVRVLGSGAIPGRRESWTDPVDEPVWEELLETWHELFGSWDSIALYHRPQIGRVGFSGLLLDRGRGVAFIRVSPTPDRIEREFAAMEGICSAGPSSFRVARPRAWGITQSWGWLATESVPNYPLGALRSEARRHGVTNEIGTILSAVLERPADVPAHWVPGHGDFAPWNVRTELSGRVWVIDWEDASYAPPGADRLYSDLTAQTTFGYGRPESAPRETVDWLGVRIAARQRPGQGVSEDDARLLSELALVAST